MLKMLTKNVKTGGCLHSDTLIIAIFALILIFS